MAMTIQEYEAKFAYRIADKKRTKVRGECRKFKQTVNKKANQERKRGK